MTASSVTDIAAMLTTLADPTARATAFAHATPAPRASPTYVAPVSVPDAVRVSPLRAEAPIDIIRAFLTLHAAPEGRKAFTRVRHVAATALDTYGPPETVVLALLEIYQDDAQGALTAARLLIGIGHLMRALVWNPVLGQLPHDLFDALGVKLDRPQYLRQMLDSASPSLYPATRELAGTLATEWEGTLDSLITTARALRLTPEFAAAG